MLENKRIHFVGIGGIGISGLAQFAKAQGALISGSDITEGALTKQLKAMGVEITIPHQESCVVGVDLVIHSAIIKQDNCELQKARSLGIPIYSRKQALPLILQDKKVYAIAGAHGKSTTTAILSSILQESSAIIGAESKEFHSNVRAQKSDYLVFEADESDKSFLACNPYCAIIANVEPEHMEGYDYDYGLFYQTYLDFLNLAKKRVINAEDSFLGGLEDLEAIRLYPSKDIQSVAYCLLDGEPYTTFNLTHEGRCLGSFEVYGIGWHIALDAALAILSVIDILDIETIRARVRNFRGIKKRFDILSAQKSIIIDDYAHHPTEISTTLSAIQTYKSMVKQEHVSVIWQPHKYSRVLNHLDEFVACFAGVDQLIILPVYSAGEQRVEIDFAKKFEQYNPIFASRVERCGECLRLCLEDQSDLILDRGVIVGFNAGDLTYQLRGGI